MLRLTIVDNVHNLFKFVVSLPNVNETRWGDLAARRKDILGAAAAIVAEESYQGLSMRRVANSAGVSTGLLYQYFATKDELFAAVVTERLERMCRDWGRLPRSGQSIEEVLSEMLPEVVALWRDVGRFAVLWSPQPQELHLSEQASLVSAWSQMMKTIGSVLTKIGAPAVAGPGSTPYAVAYVWSTLSGFADDTINGLSVQNGLERNTLTDRTISNLAATLPYSS